MLVLRSSLTATLKDQVIKYQIKHHPIVENVQRQEKTRTSDYEQVLLILYREYLRQFLLNIIQI